MKKKTFVVKHRYVKVQLINVNSEMKKILIYFSS